MADRASTSKAQYEEEQNLLQMETQKSMDTFPTDIETIHISRRLYNQNDLDRLHKRDVPEFSLKKSIKKSCSCTAGDVARHFLGYFPIVNAVRNYKLRKTAMDVLAGLSAAFMHLPQGLGFGILASLTPVYGLYSTFYPILLYVIFGTSPHVSFGTNAVLAVLTASIVEREAGLLPGAGGSGNNTTAAIAMTEQEVLDYKVGVAMAVTFLAGAILLVMGFLRLGFLTSYLSVSFIGGFTTASAIHIASSQVSKMLHIKITPYAGAGKLVKTYIEIFSRITETNIADLVIAIISILILLAVKIGINERFKSRLKIPIPIDLLIVIVATIISHFADFRGRFGVAIVGSVPTGMPAPRLPNFEALPRVGTDSFVIAILVFALTIAMAKLMARLNDYQVDDNQELVAYGMCNFVSSFFLCFPSCVAPPRTMILHTLGAKTTLNGITSAVFILIVLLAAGPLFASLPVAVLAAMIVVAMKELLLQVRTLPSIWRISRPDFAIWVTTLLVSVLVDLDIGIVVGIGVSILTIIVQNQLSSGYLVGEPADEEQVFLDQRHRQSIHHPPGTRIFSFDAQLFFANADRFKSLLYKNIFNPARRRAEKEVEVTEENGDVQSPDDKAGTGTEGSEHGAPSSEGGEIIRYLIIDCSKFSYIDIAGVNMLKQMTGEFEKAGVTVYLARVPQYTLDTLDRSGFFTTFKMESVFYDLIDAVEATKETEIHLKF